MGTSNECKRLNMNVMVMKCFEIFSKRLREESKRLTRELRGNKKKKRDKEVDAKGEEVEREGMMDLFATNNAVSLDSPHIVRKIRNNGSEYLSTEFYFVSKRTFSLFSEKTYA